MTSLRRCMLPLRGPRLTPGIYFLVVLGDPGEDRVPHLENVAKRGDGGVMRHRLFPLDHVNDDTPERRLVHAPLMCNIDPEQAKDRPVRGEVVRDNDSHAPLHALHHLAEMREEDVHGPVPRQERVEDLSLLIPHHHDVPLFPLDGEERLVAENDLAVPGVFLVALALGERVELAHQRREEARRRGLGEIELGRELLQADSPPFEGPLEQLL